LIDLLLLLLLLSLMLLLLVLEDSGRLERALII